MKKYVTLLLCAGCLFGSIPGFSQTGRTIGSGYCFSPVNGQIWGTYYAFQDPANSSTTLDNIYHWIYLSVDSRLTVVWPQRIDDENILWMNWIDYRVVWTNNYSYISQWTPLLAGEFILYLSAPQGLPAGFPATGPENQALTGSYSGYSRTNYYHNGNQWVNNSDTNWQGIGYTISPGIPTGTPAVAPTGLCDQYCKEVCQRMRYANGRWKGATPCIIMIGEVAGGQESGCDCW